MPSEETSMYVVGHKSIWLQTLVYIRIINQLSIRVSWVVKFASSAIQMSHWHNAMVDSVEFWISYQRLRLVLKKASRWHLIQNLASSTIVWRQHDIRIDIKILHAISPLPPSSWLLSVEKLWPIFSLLKGKSWFLNHVICISHKLRQIKCLCIWRDLP